MRRIRQLFLMTALILLALQFPVRAEKPTPPPVTALRVSAGGVQPQVAADSAGVVHVIYLKGDPQNSDIEYARWTEAGGLGQPIRVNSQPGSAIAVGTVRGAHLALGRDGRALVAWMGSSTAMPRGPEKATPMLYARLNDAGTGFQPQRNVMQSQPGLDGGGSIAADGRGNVYVAWHAPTKIGAGEQSRRIWLARSTDDGKTFAAEQRATDADTGACGCCGLRLFADTEGRLMALYRTADQTTHRDMTLLRFDRDARLTRSDKVGAMESAACVMSTSAFAQSPTGVVGAWETSGQIFWAAIDPAGTKAPKSMAVPGQANNRKHPAVAANAAGEILIVWTEGIGWNRGGSVAWQRYDKAGKTIGAINHMDGLPVWGSPAAFTRADGRFVVLY